MKKIFLIYIIFLFLFVILKIDFHGNFITRIHLFKSGNYKNFNTVVFNTFKMYKNNLNSCWSIFNIVGNILPFFFFGLLLKSAWKEKNFFELFFFSSGLFTLFEIIQYIFMIGVCDIDDLITNISFASFGIIIYKIFQEKLKL